jgi:ABC-type Fe3+-hydroxamate transport system substrate-binding protein
VTSGETTVGALGAAPGLRVVSLVPSVTETLLAWGVEPVAVTRFCEQPGYPTVGGTKNPDVAGIIAFRPDLVVVDREENRAEDARALEEAGLRLHVLHVRGVDDVPAALVGLRAALGLPAAAPVEPAAGPHPGADDVRAWIPIWRRPWMTISAATYGSSLLAGIGVANVFADAPDPYPEVSLEDVRARQPDVVLAPSEPYAFTERHRAELATVAPVVFVDGKDLFWWGSRTPGARDRLGRMARTLGRRDLPGGRAEGEDRPQPERPAPGR